MKRALPLLVTTGTYLALAQGAFAQINARAQDQFSNLSNFTLNGSFISALITLLFIVAIIIALIYLIWGGIKWIMSGGDKGALQAAREHVIAAIVGLVVIFLSYFIINFILGVFGLGTGYSWDIPSFTG